jgi:hypothetical protein
MTTLQEIMVTKIESKIRTMLKEDVLFHRYRGDDYREAVFAAETILGLTRERQDCIDYLSSLNLLEMSLLKSSFNLLEGRYTPYLTKEEIELVLQIM